MKEKFDAETRKQLALLARRSRARTTAFSPQQPTDWRPTQVRRPEGGFLPVFSEAAAWEFVADKLEGGHDVEVVELREPPGAKGYVMNIDLGPHLPRLYVKLQLRGGKIVGRSFHYAEWS